MMKIYHILIGIFFALLISCLCCCRLTGKFTIRIEDCSLKSQFIKTALLSAILLTTFPVSAGTKSLDQGTAVETAQSGVETQYFDPNTKPTEDFYQHINGLWLKENQIPNDKSSWGTFTILHERSVNQIRDIVDDLSSQKFTQGTDQQKVADLYASFMDQKRIDSLGYQPIHTEIAKVDALKSKKEFGALAAHFSRMGVTTPLEIGVVQDMKDSTKMIVEMDQSGLGLPDRDYYLKDDKKFKEIRQHYLAYIEKTLTLIGDTHAQKNAENILLLETQIAKAQWSNVQNRDLTKVYNIYKIKDLPQVNSQINWSDYFQAQGLTGKIETIQVAQPSYLKDLDSIIRQQSLETWQAYFKFHLVSDFSPLLSQDFIDNQFNFYSTQLREIKQQKPRWKRGIEVVQKTLGESLGKIYVEKHFSPQQKQRMEDLVQNLLKAYEQSINTLDWMSPETKLKAKEKLSKMVVKIGYPNKWRDYSALNITNDDLIGNILRSHEFEHQYELNKLGKPVDRDEWGMLPQTVNAYYNPTMNEIVFPAAILQPPFFNMQADDAVNYGAIGAVIGHEISHGFDDQGSQFDAMGNMKNWWTASDQKRFQEKTKALVEQYSRYEPLPGYHVNGELTLGENIADNSGLSIAYKAYQISLNGKPSPVIHQLTGEQRFYIGWAQSWRIKLRDSQQLEYLKSDPHSPGKVRGNGTLLNQKPFYDAFGVKQGDKMYLAPEKRVSIW